MTVSGARGGVRRQVCAVPHGAVSVPFRWAHGCVQLSRTPSEYKVRVLDLRPSEPAGASWRPARPSDQNTRTYSRDSHLEKREGPRPCGTLSWSCPVPALADRFCDMEGTEGRGQMGPP